MRRHLSDNQDGMVSIVVTVLVMLIISLIIIAFARSSRREQQQALDRQLSTQAFYAAETGVNDVVNLLKTKPDYAKSNCDQDPTNLPNAILNTDAGSGYTCVLVNPTPMTLQYDNIGLDGSKVVILKNNSPNPITGIRISWQAKDGTNTPASCPNLTTPPTSLPAATAWPGECPGALRTDIVPIPPSFTRDDLINGTMTTYLLPTSAGSASPAPAYSASTIGFGNQGQISTVKCNGAAPNYYCNVDFTVPAMSQYALRMRSVYRASVVTVTGLYNGSPIQLLGAQAVIDVTGKASDVLRRISVRIPVSSLGGGVFPDYAVLSADTLCKRFSIAPNLDPQYDAAATDDACKVDSLTP